jgi:hypothetical protein
MFSQKHRYWFRPKKFWGFFAFYYPSNLSGWIATLFLSALLIWAFSMADRHSHSSSDTLISFTPWAIAILAVFDLLCFRLGEYPSWWKKRQK